MSKRFSRFASFFLALCLILGSAGAFPAGAAVEEPLNVRDYGAVGDGTTDDLAAIQAAIDAAAAGEGGGVVTFPAGTYLVEEIIFLRSNITLLLDDEATIVNGIDRPGACIVFMTGYYGYGSDKVLWEDTENITVIGGTIDMNGELNEDRTAALNLPNVGSSGAFALGYCDNVWIEGVTFLDSYKGHAIQICACDGVTIRNCSFKGQSLPDTLTGSSRLNLECIQIEPSSTNGFPYALNETGEASRNVTVEGCYFGASDKCGEPAVAVGTHSQLNFGEKCSQINILNNVFDNMMYAGVRFCGYEDVTIRGNTFTKKTEAESVNYRAEGCFLINAYCYNNTTDELDMNRRITIDANTFNIADPVTRGIRVAKDSESYLGTVTDIAITNNIINNTAADTTELGILAMRVSDGLTVTGNTVSGGYRGIQVQYCTGNITISGNALSGLDDQYVRFISCGNNQNIYFYTHGSGSFDVSTAGNAYTVTAVPEAGYLFSAYYKQNALTDVVSTAAAQTVSLDESSNVYRHALFEACSHSYGSSVTKPTCTARGYTTYTCSLCGCSYVGSYTAASEHSYKAVTTAATCAKVGCTVYTCTVCGDSYTIYDGELTDWQTTRPEGVADSLIQTKQQYRYSDLETVTSYNSALSGYTLKSSQWEQCASGTVYFVSDWPSGFDTGHDLYSQYDHSPKTASQTTTFKTTVGDDQAAGYLYYHWCMNSYTGGPENRTTSPTQTDTCTGFHAFYSTTDPSTLTPASDGDGSYSIANGACCTDSYWYYYVPVYARTYTTYRALFTYERWTDYSDWSDTAVTASDTRQVQTRTVYRYASGTLADHSWDSGVVTQPASCTTSGVRTYTCTVCGETKTETIAARGHSYVNGSCSVCGAADPDYVSRFTLVGSNMVLGSDLDMNFFFNMTDISGTDGYVVITHYDLEGTKTYTIAYADWNTYGPYYMVTLDGLAARQMVDTIEVVVYKGDGTAVSEVWTDSIRSYALRSFASSTQTDEGRTLLVDMLNYGAAAQEFFSYNTGDLANSTLTDDQKAYATDTVSVTDKRVKGDNYVGSSLVLKSRIMLTVLFDNLTTDMYAIVSYTDHTGEAVTTRVNGSEFVTYGGYYGVMVDDLVVADGNQMVTVTICTANGTPFAWASDSMNSYAARSMGSYAIYEMVAKFATSAYAYFH